LEEAVTYLRQMEDLTSLPGYDRLRELADTVVFGAYTKWASGGGEGDYCRGQIAGLESLFQNLTESVEDYKEYVADMRKKLGTGVEDD
jgi:hypothetical protein